MRLRLLVFMLSLGTLALLLGISSWALQGFPKGNSSHGSHAPRADTSIPSITSDLRSKKDSVSPLIFGTNLSLYDSNDQVLTSANTRNQLQQLHFRIVRMPTRPNLSNETEIEAARAIKNMGAYPLLILRGGVDNNVLSDDIRMVNNMNSIFGDTTVFYEYGNEEDLLGINVTHYTASWNAIVPQLKRLALHGQFIGPVNFQYDHDYLTSFLQYANPRPDQVSWHEYTCSDSWSNDVCISHIDNWTQHISDARQTMRATIGTALPIMITEWNYASDAHVNDGKINDSKFMTAWTTKALETLAANRIFASMQYTCTNSVYALITSDGIPSAQGIVIQTTYQRMIVNGRQPTPVPTANSG